MLARFPRRFRDELSAVPDPTSDRDWFSPRVRLGVMAVAMLVAAAIWNTETTAGKGFQAALVRIGVVTAAAWLAWPSLVKVRWLPRTRLGRAAAVALLAMTAARPWVFGPIAAAMLLLTMFRPHRGNPGDRRT